MGYGYGNGQHPNNITPGADNFGDSAGGGGMAGIAYGVADRNARESGLEAMRNASRVPPPPSRMQHGEGPYYQGGGAYPYGGYGGYGGGPSHASSMQSMGHSDSYADDPYQGLSSSVRGAERRLGEVNPHEIEDDGDDGLEYPRPQRHSILSSAANSDRGARPGVGAASAVAGAAGAGGVIGGMLSKSRPGAVQQYDLSSGREKSTEWAASREKRKKRIRWAIIIAVGILIAGAIVGGVIGGLGIHKKGGGGDSDSGNSGDSAEEDANRNGDLSIKSQEIKDLMDNPDLHKVFPGMDYTPIHSQYPYCMHDPPSQNNVTRDIAVLSQLTNRVRLYGTDCNQTQMVIHAIQRLELQDDVKIWLGVWQDDNSTTNARQLDQMWDVLEEYGGDYFEGLIVANEILFREEMTISELSKVLKEVRSKLADMDIDLPVATSDLGDDWDSDLAAASDYLMSNIHPFFAGVPASEAASWTVGFWEDQNSPYFRSDKSKNIISETGWPTGGGTNCGSASVTDCPDGSVAGIDELNQFMKDWVCPALKNGTEYFWFSAFDEPWKESFNEEGKEWEDKWGLMDVNRNLKDGVKIPDCDGTTITS